MTAQTIEWNGAQVAALEGMIGEKLSAAEIGRALGCSRNAVIGKVRRMGLQLASVHAEKRKRRRAAPQPGRVADQQRRLTPAVVVRLRADEPQSLNLTLVDLRDGQCHWPHGEVAPYAFCGHATAEGEPYCAHHDARVRDDGATERFRAQYGLLSQVAA